MEFNVLVSHLQGGFQAQMTRREALLILGVREHAKEEVVKDAHRKIMIANHPDAGNHLEADNHFLVVYDLSVMFSFDVLLHCAAPWPYLL
jgi:hypothetical protein